LLAVNVAQGNPVTLGSEVTRYIGGNCGFTHATFDICNSNDTHERNPSICAFQNG
jgi:hypothetical protein